MECPECEGGGFIAKLYPNGHTEVRCETCGGSGVIESEYLCECGVDASGSGEDHSDYCPKSEGLQL